MLADQLEAANKMIKQLQQEKQVLIDQYAATSKASIHTEFTQMAKMSRVPYAIERNSNGKTWVSSIDTAGNVKEDMFLCDLNTYERLVKEFKAWADHDNNLR